MMGRMAHYDLLPRVAQLHEELVARGLSEQLATEALRSVGFHLSLWAEYHDDEYKKYGNKEDKGAAEAVRELSVDLSGAPEGAQ